MLQKTQESPEYVGIDQLLQKKARKSDGSKDLPKFDISDFNFVTVLGKGSFGKVCCATRTIGSRE